MTKLRLVAGTINVYEAEEGWTNYCLDITDRGVWDRKLNMAVRPDFIGDIRNLVDFRDEMFDAVQLWHVLEHLDREGGEQALQEIRRVLVPSGELDIEVPDMAAVCAAFVSGELDDAGFQQWTYGEDIGGHGNQADFHRHGWTAATLADALAQAGFAIYDVPPTGLAIRYVCRKIEVASE